MFGSANRDEEVFQNPDHFDISRDNRSSISFGAGPHFCAGAWISKTLISEVALPLFFSNFPNVQLKNHLNLRVGSLGDLKKLFCRMWINNLMNIKLSNIFQIENIKVQKNYELLKGVHFSRQLPVYHYH